MNSRQRPLHRLLRTLSISALLTLCAASAGYWLAGRMPALLLLSFLKYSLAIIGLVWVFSYSIYSKLSDLTDITGLDYRQHRDIEVEIRQRLRGFWLRALYIAALGLGMYSPVLLSDAKLPIPAWAYAVSLSALVLALLALWQLWAELEDIRALKSRLKELERREKERADQLQQLKGAQPEDWQADPGLDGFRDRQ